MYLKNEKKWQKSLIREIAKDMNLDIRVVREIAHYPLLFLRKKVMDEYDESAVRIKHLGVFYVKRLYGKRPLNEKRAKLYSDNSSILWDKLFNYKKEAFASEQDYLDYIDYSLKNGLYRSFKEWEPLVKELLKQNN